MSNLNPLCRTDRVYLTRSIDGARFFASAAPNPVVYEAVPEEEIEPDPDCTEPGISIACQKARIIAIHKIPGKVIKKNRKRMGPVAGLVGIEGGVVSGVINLESPDVSASGRRPRHENRYHDA
jgi:hypothetical protein